MKRRKIIIKNSSYDIIHIWKNKDGFYNVSQTLLLRLNEDDGLRLKV